MRRTVLLSAVLLAFAAAPAEATLPLTRTEVVHAVRAFERKYDGTPYTFNRCRVGRRHAWCVLNQHPDWYYRLPVTVDITHGALLVYQEPRLPELRILRRPRGNPL